MNTSYLLPLSLREALDEEFNVKATAGLLSEFLILGYSAKTYQRLLSKEVADLPHEIQLALAAILRGMGKGDRVQRMLPSLKITKPEETRLNRISQMIRRGSYRETQKIRALYEHDIKYLMTGEFPKKGFVPLCAASGPPYVSEEDIKTLGILRLSSKGGKNVAFSYMSPIENTIPGQAFTPRNIVAVVDDFYQLPQSPKEHATQRWELILKRWSESKQKMFFERSGPGLRSFRYREGSEEKGDPIAGLDLTLHHSHYFEGRVTNYALDEFIPGRPILLKAGINAKLTYRDEWAHNMASFDEGPLANLIQVNAFVITTGDPGGPRIHLAWRGEGTATNAALAGTTAWAPTISGAANLPDYRLENGAITYLPANTMLREGEEEIWGREQAPPGSSPIVRFLGLSRVFTSYEPFLFGHVELDCAADDLKHAFNSGHRDRFDVRSIHDLKLVPDEVFKFTRDVSPLQHANAGVTVSVVLFMLYHELRYRFPDDIKVITDEFVNALTGEK